MYGQVDSVTIWKFCHQQNNYQKEVKKKRLRLNNKSELENLPVVRMVQVFKQNLSSVT